MTYTFFMWGARSPSTGQFLNEIHPGQDLVRDYGMAERFAETFALKLNTNRHMHTDDWVGYVEEKEHRDGTPDVQ